MTKAAWFEVRLPCQASGSGIPQVCAREPQGLAALAYSPRFLPFLGFMVGNPAMNKDKSIEITQK